MTANRPPDREPPALPAGPARAVAGDRGDRRRLADRHGAGVRGARPARLAARSRSPVSASACLARRSSCGNVRPCAAAPAARKADSTDSTQAKEEAMAAPLLQAQIDIDAPVPKVWALISDLEPDAAVEPAVPADEAARPLRPGSQDHQPQPPQVPVLADDVHDHRGHPGEEAGVPGQPEQHHLELSNWSRPTPAPG